MTLDNTYRHPANASGFHDIVSPRTLCVIKQLELNRLPLRKSLEALSLNGAMMDEHVVAVLNGDKAVALLIAEPFNDSGWHLLSPPFRVLKNRKETRPPALLGPRSVRRKFTHPPKKPRSTGIPRDLPHSCVILYRPRNDVTTLQTLSDHLHTLEYSTFNRPVKTLFEEFAPFFPRGHSEKACE